MRPDVCAGVSLGRYDTYSAAAFNMSWQYFRWSPRSPSTLLSVFRQSSGYHICADPGFFCGVAVRWNASRSGDANPQVPTRGPSQTCVPRGLLWQHPRAHICQDMQRPGGSRCIHFTSRAHSGRLLSGGFQLISYFGWVCDGTCSSGRLFDVIEAGRGSLSFPPQLLLVFLKHDTRPDHKLFNHIAAFDPSLTLTCISHREKSTGAQGDWGKLVRFILLWPWSSGCLVVAVAGCVQLPSNGPR